MNLFIDTNILLSFYHYSNEDLEELRKLAVLINQPSITLHLPRQVIDEFERNRDNKIADGLKILRSGELPKQFPQMCQDYDEYQTMRTAINDFEKARSELMEKLGDDIKNNRLKADLIIELLFNNGNIIEITDDLLERSRRRFDLGNPPGKRKSYGDAINWECLLESVIEGADLYLIADDNDYFAKTDYELFSPFLAKEWQAAKSAKVIAYRRLSDFFRDKFPNINLASELDKDLLIKNLMSSKSFASTRSTMEKLIRYGDFTYGQINDIVSACISNSQIYWIIGDDDIKNYVQQFVYGYTDKIIAENFLEIEKLLEV